jgi:hypothetical protein
VRLPTGDLAFAAVSLVLLTVRFALVDCGSRLGGAVGSSTFPVSLIDPSSTFTGGTVGVGPPSASSGFLRSSGSMSPLRGTVDSPLGVRACCSASVASVSV